MSDNTHSTKYLCGVYDEIGIVAQQIKAAFTAQEIISFADLDHHGTTLTYTPTRRRHYQRLLGSSPIRHEAGKKDYFFNSCNFVVIKLEPTSAQSHSMYTGALRALLDGRIIGVLAISYALSIGVPSAEQIIELCDPDEQIKLRALKAAGRLRINNVFSIDTLRAFLRAQC